MGRTEHYRDPDAPPATRIVVAAQAFVQDDAGRILLIQRSDNGLWAPPGGAQSIGERVGDAAVRETKEETGYDVEVIGMVGVYSDPAHVIAYDNGEVRQQFALCFRARLVGGAAITSDESPQVRWVAPEQLDGLPIHPSIRLRLDDALLQQAEPAIR